MIRGLHYLVQNPGLVGARYARVTLARRVQRQRKELPRGVKVPEEDEDAAKGFFRSAERIVTRVGISLKAETRSVAKYTQGELVENGSKIVPIYFDINSDAKEPLELEPIAFCVPNNDSKTYQTSCMWNFASQCRQMGTLDLTKVVKIKVGNLLCRPRKGIRRLWVNLQIAVTADLTVTVYWRHDGSKPVADENKTVLTVSDLGEPLVDEFRVPLEQQRSSGSKIPEDRDDLPRHLRDLTTAKEGRNFSQRSSLGRLPCKF